MSTEITKDQAKVRLKELDIERQQLESIINAPIDEKDIIDLMSYEYACRELNIKQLTIDDFSNLPIEDQDSQLAFHELTVQYRCIKKGRIPDYINVNENKWFPIFVWDKKSSGFVFSRSGFGSWTAATLVGARLSVFDENTSNRAAKKLEKTWDRFLKPYQP